MNKNIAILALFLLGAVASSTAQSEKYTKAMEPLVRMADSSNSVEKLLSLSNSFQRIADAEKTQWQPFYYAAYCQVHAAQLMAGQPNVMEKTDPLADKAEALIKQAEALSKDNSEIWCVKKMISSVRMVADPMNRYMAQAPIATEALNNARKFDPQNPRVDLLEGQDKFYTPEQFGGSKAEAKKLFQASQAKFASFKPKTPLDPNWGMNQVQYFLEQ